MGHGARPAGRAHRPLSRAADALRRHGLGLHTLLTVAQAQFAEQALPGPTGERNTLRHRARGSFAVLGRGDAGLAAVVSALAARATASTGSVATSTRPGLAGCRLAGGCRHCCPMPPCQAWRTTVPAWRSRVRSDAAHALSSHWPSRPGAILPLVTSAGHVQQLYRFTAEQTLTVNTAAAGGNAALLAGSTNDEQRHALTRQREVSPRRPGSRQRRSATGAITEAASNSTYRFVEAVASPWPPGSEGVGMRLVHTPLRHRAAAIAAQA